VMSSALAVERLVVGADMVIGAVLVPGARAPHLVTAETVSAMHPGSVLVDISIDQGGCFETSHVTTHSDPTFVVDEVVHYCVGNMPGAVPRTSTYALTNVTLPYVVGIDEAVRADPALALGVNVVAGTITNDGVGAAHGLDVAPIAQLIGGGAG
jgi:alanine dehydrogenase